MPRRHFPFVLRLLAPSLLALLGACDEGPVSRAHASPAAGETPTPTSSSDDEEAAVDLALPPSGTYDVRTRISADGCATAPNPPTSGTAVVLVRARGDQVAFNVPLPPQSGGGTWARSDLSPGRDVERTLPALATCTDFVAQRTTTLRSVTADAFEVVETTTYGDPGACALDGPVSCTAQVVSTYTLVQSQCPATCTADARVAIVDGRPTVEIECGCAPRGQFDLQPPLGASL